MSIDSSEVLRNGARLRALTNRRRRKLGLRSSEAAEWVSSNPGNGTTATVLEPVTALSEQVEEPVVEEQEKPFLRSRKGFSYRVRDLNPCYRRERAAS